MDTFPLVSIGVPTYNRFITLVRAVESILAQEYEGPLEILIADNASTDETEEYCRALVAKDTRIRYFRQPRNMGPPTNFHTCVDNARGEFFMWLADDDWFGSKNLLQRCTEELLMRPDCIRVCGEVRYFNELGLQPISKNYYLMQESPVERVCSFYEQVVYNGVFYGLTRTRDLQRVRFRNVAGGDWLLVAELIFLGKILILEDVYLDRHYKKSEQRLGTTRRVFSLRKFQVQHPYTSIAVLVFKDIAWESNVYSVMSPIARYRLAMCCSKIVARRYMFRPYARKISSKAKSYLSDSQWQSLRRIYARMKG